MKQPANNPLRPRDAELLLLMAEGHSISEVASLLFLSPAAVGSARRRLLRLLGASSLAAAVATALRNRWIE